MVGEYVLRRKRSRYNAKTRLQEMARRVNEELDTNTSTLEESNIHAEMDVRDWKSYSASGKDTSENFSENG